jgi:hypothetical protein
MRQGRDGRDDAGFELNRSIPAGAEDFENRVKPVDPLDDPISSQ